MFLLIWCLEFFFFFAHHLPGRICRIEALQVHSHTSGCCHHVCQTWCACVCYSHAIFVRDDLSCGTWVLMGWLCVCVCVRVPMFPMACHPIVYEIIGVHALLHVCPVELSHLCMTTIVYLCVWVCLCVCVYTFECPVWTCLYSHFRHII